jgi:flagellar biosynthesis/type III secretory pathway M-ring protein FliF/YscJ
MASFQFDYTKYQNPNISVQQLDSIAETVFQPAANTTTFSRVMSCVLLGFGLAYIIARKVLVDQQAQIEEQEYEAGQTNSNQGEVNNQNPTPVKA